MTKGERDISTLQARGHFYLALTNEAEYWLFELGYARPLPQPLSMSGLRTFKFQLTNAAELLTAKNWDELPKRYALLK